MEVRLNSTLRGLCGKRSLDLELTQDATVRDALRAVVSLLPILTHELLDDAGGLQPTIIVFLNGRDIRFYDGLDTALKPDQTLDVFPRTGVQRAFASE